MTYQVIIKHSAEKELDALPASLHERIAERLLALEENPRPVGSRKLQGQESYRLRVGDYRVLYTIDDKAKKVVVLAVGHRREVYR
jgi:mRNA interferase RelE/StbE